MKFRFFLLITGVFAAGFCRAQHKEMDSLKNVLGITTSDTQRVNTCNALMRQLIMISEYDSALRYGGRSIKMAEELATVSDAMLSKVGKKALAAVNTYFGIIYYNRGLYPDAIKKYYTSLKIREELGDQSGVAATYHNIGNVYYALENKKAAMDNFKLSMNIKRGMKDTLDSHYAHTINNIGNFYNGNRDHVRAMQYYKLALEIEEKINDLWGVVSTYNNIANVLMEQKKPEEALVMYFKCVEIEKQIGDKEGFSALYNNIGNLYAKTLRPREALKYLNMGLKLALEIGSKEDISISYNHLTDVYAYLKDHKNSLRAYKNYIAYKDSLNNEENTKRMVRTEMNFEFEKKEAANKLDQEKKAAVAAAESKKQRMILLLVSCVLVLVAVFAGFAYRSFLQKQKANREITLQKDIIEAKQKEILDSIHYAKRIQTALLPSQKYIERNLKRLRG